MGWRVRIESGFEDVVAFGLTSDGCVVPLVVAEGGTSIVEFSGKDFSLIGPVNFAMLERASALQNGQYGRLREYGRWRVPTLPQFSYSGAKQISN